MGMKSLIDIVRSDKYYTGCGVHGVDSYSETTGIDLSTTDYEHPKYYMTGILCDAGSGNIKLQMTNGGTMILPVTVDTGYFQEVLRGYAINKIIRTGTTFTGHIFPIF
jgi:hypothetical protein